MKVNLYFMFLFIIISNISCSKSYEIKKIKIENISYSKNNTINNDIRFIDNYFYIYSTKDTSYKHWTGGEGILYSIIKIDRNYNLIEENKIKNKIEFDFNEKYYYINEEGNIVYHKLLDKIGPPNSSIIEIYNNNVELIKKIDTGLNISGMDFYLDKDDIVYYNGFSYEKSGSPDYTDFCVYKNKNFNIIKKNKISPLFSFNIYTYNSSFYMLIDLDLIIFNKNDFLIKDNIKAINRKNITSYLYKNTNLIFYYKQKTNGTLINNNIFYQIRFLSPSEDEISNDRARVNSTSTTIQTYIIGIDLEKEELVKEIKINYKERKVAECPNSYTVDNEGNIYILDSKNTKIIKIDKSVNKVEFNY